MKVSSREVQDIMEGSFEPDGRRCDVCQDYPISVVLVEGRVRDVDLDRQVWTGLCQGCLTQLWFDGLVGAEIFWQVN